MTDEQMDELMTVAVNMQRDSEKAGDRPSAMFAYAVQVAVLELRNVRDDAAALAAENAGLNAFVDALLSIAWQGGSADGAEIQELALKHGLLRQEVYSADEHENQVDDPGNFEDGDPVYFRVETPATDAFLAEVRASAIPEGYVLVPQEMHLSSEAMEGICFHCGDGGFAFGEFTDGLLFVGAIDDSDGQKIHGLHIATADYPEEGCATICAFLPAPTEGVAQ